MAIREVLTSFTFEQQRQMINLIGTDVGDASTLLTPTNVLVSGINEIVNGDVDLINQTHGMDAGSLASPSLYWDAGQGFYKVDANKIGLSTGLAIAGNLEVDGDITFRAGAGSGGTLTFGDLNTDNIVFNAELTSSIVPDSTANYSLGSSSKQWNNLYIDGTASIDTLSVDENSTFTGYLQVDSGDIRVPSTTATVDLFDDYATTVEAFGAGTAIRLGATTGTLTLRNPTIVGSETTQALFNTVATTVNAFGAATTINMGVSGGGGNTNFNILSDDVVCSGDLNVNGGELLSSSNTVDVFINNTVNIGNSTNSGNTTINNELKLAYDLSFENASGYNTISIPDNQENALKIKEGDNSYMQFRTDNGNERVIVWKDLYVVGNLDISGSTTTIDVTTLSIEDKNIELGASAAPSDTTADGGGITLKGTTDKTITYNDTDGVWKSNIGFAVGPVVGDVLTSQSTTGLSANLFVGKGGSSKVFTVDESGNLKIGTDVTSASTTKVSLNVDGTGTFTNSLRVDHANNAGSDVLVRLGNVNNSGTNSAHLFLANGFYVSPTAIDGTGAAAKILADGTIVGRLGIHAGAGVNVGLTTGHVSYLTRMTASGTTVTVPANTLTAGDMCSVFNVSTGNITIAAAAGVTMYHAADGATGNRTLAAKGLCTILCSANNEFIISGGGLS